MNRSWHSVMMSFLLRKQKPGRDGEPRLVSFLLKVGFFGDVGTELNFSTLHMMFYSSGVQSYPRVDGVSAGHSNQAEATPGSTEESPQDQMIKQKELNLAPAWLV